ncbi:hypothetical protein EU527_09145 [Candidatus Thorarchaeota archaeon]|nr:MAG: hypothetical protein EU527_09145 [Candidatus Thorarchaeota archaeon]
MRVRFHTMRTGIGLLIALPLCLLIFLSNPPWDTPGAATAYYSILAFLSVTITASIANRIRIDPSASNNVLFAGTGYASIIFAGAAIFYILTGETPVIHSQPSGIFLNLVALATTGIIMVLYSTLDQITVHGDSKWEKESTPIIIIIISVVIFVSLMVVVRQPISNAYFLGAGYVTGIIATISFTLAAFMMFRNRRIVTSSDPYRMIISFLFFAGASINHMLILPEPSSNWIFSIALMGLGLIVANIAISYPFLRDIGVRDNVAYGVTIVTSLFALIPFILSHAIEVLIGSGIIIEIGATVLVHVGGAVLAGLSAYALYMKLKTRFSPGQLAIVFLLIFWMTAEVAIVLTHFTPMYGFNSETLVPYVCGIIVSSIIFILAVRNMLNPTHTKFWRTKAVYVLGLLGPAIFILFGEYIRLLLFSLFPDMPTTIIGTSIMLGMSYIVLYTLLTYILLLTGTSGGDLTFESIGAALASVWVIVIILKSNFGYATPGWWVAESIMYMAVVFFAILTLNMYLTASKEFEKTIPAATAFSNILSETIVRHQELAIDRLTELTSETQTSEKRLDLLAGSLHEISQANEFAKYIRAVVTETKFESDDLESINLMDTITNAMNRLKIPDEVLKFKEEKDELHRRYALANNLLVEVFYYLFMGISNRIGSIDLLGVDVSESEIFPETQLEITFDIVVKSADVNERVGLIKRYSESHSMDVIEFAYSKRIVGLFGGSMNWNIELISNQDILLTVKIILNSV